MFVDAYLPGFRAGGPITAVANLVEYFGDDHQFRIVTSNSDAGSPAYSVEPNVWHRVGKADVCYLSPDRSNLAGIRRVVSSLQYDVLYMNSLFSPRFTIGPLVLRRFGLITPSRTVVAPRGELLPDALAIKRDKKHVYLGIARTLQLYRDVIWQVAGPGEEREVKRWFGGEAQVITAPDLPWLAPDLRRREKTPGTLQILFLSRISRMKNLFGALSLLSGLAGSVQMDIYGPIEDEPYWLECQSVISSLPPNIRVRYCGPAKRSDVAFVMADHDVFFLPSLGEGFGHAIIEALGSGCPVVISDRTPWRGLEDEGVGWDISLENPDSFRKALQYLADIGPAEFKRRSDLARGFARNFVKASGAIEQNRKLFDIAGCGDG